MGSARPGGRRHPRRDRQRDRHPVLRRAGAAAADGLADPAPSRPQRSRRSAGGGLDRDHVRPARADQHRPRAAARPTRPSGCGRPAGSSATSPPACWPTCCRSMSPCRCWSCCCSSGCWWCSACRCTRSPSGSGRRGRAWPRATRSSRARCSPSWSSGSTRPTTRPMVGESPTRRGRKSLPERIEPPVEVERAEDDREDDARPGHGRPAARGHRPRGRGARPRRRTRRCRSGWNSCSSPATCSTCCPTPTALKPGSAHKARTRPPMPWCTGSPRCWASSRSTPG